MRTDRVITLVFVVAITQGFLLIADPRGVLSGFFSPDYALPITLVLLVALMVLTAGIADATVRSHPQAYLLTLPTLRIGRGENQRRTEYAPYAWILPSLLVVGGYIFLRLFDSVAVQVIGAVVNAGLLLLVLFAQYYSVGRQERLYGWATIGLNIATYLTAFLFYGAIYNNKWRALLSAPAVGLVTFLLSYELLRQTRKGTRSIILYAGVAALGMGEATWALNYWQIPGLVGGITLLLAFYVLIGLMQSYLTGNLSRDVIREYVFVSFVAIGLIVYSVFRQVG